jgi:hypothetical protein
MDPSRGDDRFGRRVVRLSLPDGGGGNAAPGRGWGGATRGRAAQRGGGRAYSDAPGRAGVPRRPARDHAHSKQLRSICEPLSAPSRALPHHEGAEPARRRKHNTPVMFSEGQARGLPPRLPPTLRDASPVTRRADRIRLPYAIRCPERLRRAGGAACAARCTACSKSLLRAVLCAITLWSVFRIVVIFGG